MAGADEGPPAIPNNPREHRQYAMDPKDLAVLRILVEVERDSLTTQRQLSRRLHLSLGLVNCFVKRLARKGFFKITTFPPRRVKYLLTPKGMAEKCRLTQEYLEYSLCYFKNIRQALKREVEDLRAEGLTRVALVGAGELAELTYLTLREQGLEVVLTGDLAGEQDQFLGHVLVPPEDLAQQDCQAVLVALIQGGSQAMDRLRDLGIPCSRLRLISGDSGLMDAHLDQALPLVSGPGAGSPNHFDEGE